MDVENRKTVYVKLEDVINIVQQAKKNPIEEQKNCKSKDDYVKFALAGAKIGALTDLHVAIICDIQRFTAEQVAAENAEEMVEKMAEEAGE